MVSKHFTWLGKGCLNFRARKSESNKVAAAKTKLLLLRNGEGRDWKMRKQYSEFKDLNNFECGHSMKTNQWIEFVMSWDVLLCLCISRVQSSEWAEVSSDGFPHYDLRLSLTFPTIVPVCANTLSQDTLETDSLHSAVNKQESRSRSSSSPRSTRNSSWFLETSSEMALSGVIGFCWHHGQESFRRRKLHVTGLQEDCSADLTQHVRHECSVPTMREEIISDCRKLFLYGYW